MKAIVQERFGPPDVLRLVDTDPPEVGADDVLVRVHAAALNPYDWHIMRGDPLIARLMGEVGLRKPKARVAGVDAAGRVEAVGANVRGLRPGDGVLGFCRGAFAEYAAAVAETTALRGIRDVGAVRAGHRVLVNGAAGGVGTYAVQIAAALGAEVTGVCSTRNVELVRSIGATHVVDYTTEDFTDGPARADSALGCRVAIHSDSVCRSARRRRRDRLDRDGWRLLRQRDGRVDHRALQDRMRPPRRAVPHRRRPRTGHPVLGSLVQHQPAALGPRLRDTDRVRRRLLPSDQRPAAAAAGRTRPPLNPGRFRPGRGSELQGQRWCGGGGRCWIRTT